MRSKASRPKRRRSLASAVLGALTRKESIPSAAARAATVPAECSTASAASGGGPRGSGLRRVGAALNRSRMAYAMSAVVLRSTTGTEASVPPHAAPTTMSRALLAQRFALQVSSPLATARTAALRAIGWEKCTRNARSRAEPSRAEPRRAEPRRGERTHRYCTPTTKNKDERTMHLTNYSITKHDEARAYPLSLCTFAPLPLGLFPLSG